MNAVRLTAVVVAMTLLSSVAPAHEVKPNYDSMHSRAEQMDRMVDRLPGINGKQRHELARPHMSMMQEQMNDMHGMMKGHGGMMMPGGRGAQPDMQQGPESMQQRMDMMQKMMEHMIRQQEMMMDDDGN